MKILQINAVYGFGSTGIIVEDINDLIQEKGWESFIGYVYFSKSMKNGYKIGTNADYKKHALLSRLTGKQGFYSKQSTKKLLQYINTIQPDIIHLHNLHSNYINIEILLNYIADNNIALVVTLHDCWFFTGKCYHYLKYNCYKWKTGCNHCPAKTRELPNYLLDHSKMIYQKKCKLFKNIKNITIVGVSNWISDEAKQSFFFDKNIITIYNGVDTNIFYPRKNNLRIQYRLEDKFLILIMANKWFDNENKNYVKEIEKVLKDDEIIILAGCSSKQVNLVKGINKIYSIGYIYDKNELCNIYSMVDIFLNITLVDTLPTVIMESICCGTPVITHDVGGCSELIDNETGIVFEKQNVYELRNCLDIIKNRQFTKCAMRGMEKFNKGNCYKKYIDLYESLVNYK